MRFYSDDPIYDQELYDRQQERRLACYPECAHCGYKIQDERLFDFGGELYHIKCAEQEFQKWTEDYMA